MEPRIQYAKTSDGVMVGYAVVGSGPPLVFASQIWGSLHMAQKDVDVMGYWSMDDFLTVARSRKRQRPGPPPSPTPAQPLTRRCAMSPSRRARMRRMQHFATECGDQRP